MSQTTYNTSADFQDDVTLILENRSLRNIPKKLRKVIKLKFVGYKLVEQSSLNIWGL